MHQGVQFAQSLRLHARARQLNDAARHVHVLDGGVYGLLGLKKFAQPVQPGVRNAHHPHVGLLPPGTDTAAMGVG